MLYIILLWSNNNAYWLFDSCNNLYLCRRFTNDGCDSLVRRHFYSSEHNYYNVVYINFGDENVLEIRSFFYPIMLYTFNIKAHYTTKKKKDFQGI